MAAALMPWYRVFDGSVGLHLFALVVGGYAALLFSLPSALLVLIIPPIAAMWMVVSAG